MTYLDLFYIAIGFGLGNLFYHFIGPKSCIADAALERERMEKAFNEINDYAPPMYKYNDVEFGMVQIARKALKTKK